MLLGRRHQDHPRSRGVYLLRDLNNPRRRGIIPARAGFTQGEAWESISQRDHPRSRGVYARLLRTARFMMGSSPLARGLPIPQFSIEQNNRIIPARAGFTAYGDRKTQWGKDHPRSRGVYTRKIFPVASIAGSSPLARGLLSRRLSVCPAWRIIPARAGFTSSRATRTLRLKDHPRSRGVYHY